MFMQNDVEPKQETKTESHTFTPTAHCGQLIFLL